ncbi:hypothetical protein [Leeuwenhoekiella sp. W20_SRS_FM14]|uniref:hypothetical protein n=1 Tax=Leeuwenhoekiella sp. W20_SRS_FM14 TaxID=3240270 RepID=UPI003F950917
MENTAQDIDLFDAFKWLRRQFKKLIIYLYRFVRFLLRNALIIIGLIILGFALGYGISTLFKQSKTAEIIVGPNVESTTYLYSKIDQLNRGILSADSSLISEFETILPQTRLAEVTIEPVEDVLNLLENNQLSNDELSAYLLDNNTPESSFFEKPLLTPVYNLHRITLTASGNFEDPAMFMSLLEKEEHLQAKLKAETQNLKEELKSNEYTIKQIDSVLVNLNLALKSGTQSLAVIAVADDSNLSSILNSKLELIRRNAQIKKQLLNLKTVFKVHSYSKWLNTNSWKTNLKFILPLAFILLFIVYHATLRFKKRFKADL